MPLAATVEDWRGWAPEDKQALLTRLRSRARGDWRARARPDQLPPDGEWQTLLLRGGRGSGKTWAGAHILAELIDIDPARATEGPGQWAIIAPTYGDARDTCVEGESGLLAALATTRGEVDSGASATVATWNRSLGELILHDGSVVFVDGADDGALRIQGKNLRGAWCDEVGLWKRWEQAWDESLGYALRKGHARRVATGTPKRTMPARRLIRRLLEDPDVVSRRLRTEDNRRNLSDAFWQRVAQGAGTQLGRQELEGELLRDVEGAMWRLAWIEAKRVEGLPYPDHERGLKTTVVGLDPADGLEDGDEQALTVAGLGWDWQFYVLASEGMRGSTLEYLTRALTVARSHGAARIVVERNHGGAFLTELLEQAIRTTGIRVPYEVVSASQGKQTRAEPVAMLYEQGRVSHLGYFPELEEQQTSWTGAGGEKSPDRLDSLVHAMTSLMGLNYHGPASSDGAAVPYRDDPRGVIGAAVAWQ